MRGRYELETFFLGPGETFKLIDHGGALPVHLVAFNKHDLFETLSASRTFQELGNVFLTQRDPLFSNQGQKLLEIASDTVGEHDFFSPSPLSFKEFYAFHGIKTALNPSSFNVFSRVEIDNRSGAIKHLPSESEKGDSIEFRACVDLMIGLAGEKLGVERPFKSAKAALLKNHV